MVAPSGVGRPQSGLSKWADGAWPERCVGSSLTGASGATAAGSALSGEGA